MDFGIGQRIANYIMRPPRMTYKIQDLGPSTFQHRKRVYQRSDFVIKNSLNLSLQCSLFHPLQLHGQTIIMLHANSSSRMSAKNYLSDLLPFYNVACFDCAGSGISQGHYVTLGYNQKEDLYHLLHCLAKKYQLNNFILWGRSMGAVTALLYAAKYQNISAVIADNAFSDLQQVCIELKDNFFSLIPDFLVSSMIQYAQQHIQQNMCKTQATAFKIQQLKPKLIVSKIKCPILYIYSEQDKIVNNRHTKLLYELSNFPKKIISLPGDHNGLRDSQLKGKVIDYLLQISLQRKKKNNHKVSPTLDKKVQVQMKLIEQKDNVDSTCSIDYQSPLDQRLCQKYKSTKRKSFGNKINSQEVLTLHKYRSQFHIGKDSYNYQTNSRQVLSVNKLERAGQNLSLNQLQQFNSRGSISQGKRLRKKIFD